MSSESEPLVVSSSSSSKFCSHSKGLLALLACTSAICLALTIALIAVVVQLQESQGRRPLTWSQCNQRGEGVFQEGAAPCLCWSCFSGQFCETSHVESCTLPMAVGDPSIFREYFARREAVVSSEFYTPFRGLASSFMLYEDASAMSSSTNDSFGHLPVDFLGDTIKLLHSRAQNAVTEGKHLVVGLGGTQILRGLAAVAPTYLNQSRVSVFARTPFYGGYPQLLRYVAGATWNTSHEIVDEKALVQFVTWPNNPDGVEFQPPFYGNAALDIYDLAYYWPGTTNVTRAIDEDVMVFTASKVSGGAGSRLGWAWLRDERLAKLLVGYIDDATLGMSADSMLRVNDVMHKIIFDSPGFALGIEHYVRQTLQDRYGKLRVALKGLENRFAIESTDGFFYLWLRCLQPQDQPCHMSMQTLFNTDSRPGTVYGADDSYVRLTAATYDHVFAEFVSRVKNFARKTDATRA